CAVLSTVGKVFRDHGILWSPAYDHAAMARKWQPRRGWFTAETPAMLARPRACADRAIRSGRSPGGGAAARRRPIAVGLRWPSPTSPGSSTNTGGEHRV